MRWRDLDAAVVWRLHLASECRLGAEVVRAFNKGLLVNLVATRTGDGTRSVVVLGVDDHGTTKTYVEVELVDTDATQAHEHLRLDDVLASARASLAYVDEVLAAVRQGKPVPARQSPRGAS